MTEAKRPNILFITSDQQRADCFGFQGRNVKTPHLDQLARQGTHFDACITPNVVCQPTRASILTGLLPRTHGAHDNGIDLDPALGEKGFAGALAQSGYDTGFIGKAHFASYFSVEPTGSPESVKSSANFGKDWFGPYMGFEHVELMLIGHNYFLPPKPPQGQHFERWFYEDGKGDEKNALYNTHLPPETDAAQTWHSALPTAWHNSSWVGDRTVDYLKKAKDQDKPFCLWTSFPDPHHPMDAPEPWSRMHHPDEVDLPEYRQRDLDRRPWWHRAVVESAPSGDKQSAKWRSEYSRMEPQSDRQLRDLIANYYGMISLVDHNVGRILMALDEAGLADNTIVVFSSDHGDWLGDHGLILKGPMHYEGLLKVGLIMRGPGIPAGKKVMEPVSTLDLSPTFNDYAKAAALQTQHGTSLRSLIEKEGGIRDYAFNEWDLLPARVGVPLDLTTIRTKTHKLTFESGSEAGELYDLVNDPHEMDNRYNDAGVAVVQKELMDMVRSRPDDKRPMGVPVGAA